MSTNKTVWNKPSAVSGEQDPEDIAREQRRYQRAWNDLSDASIQATRRILLVPVIAVAVYAPLSHFIDDNAAFGIAMAASILVQAALHFLRPIRSTRNFPCPRCGQPFFSQTTPGGSFRPISEPRSSSGIFDNWNGSEDLRCTNCGLPRGALPPDFYPPDTPAPMR